jgi:Domain of unknown function (DUF2382)
MATTDRSTVLNVFENETQAQQAMDDLKRKGINTGRISYYERKSGIGITSSLERLGLPEQEASFYNEEFEADHPVVMVNTDERRQEVSDLLYRNGGYDFHTRDAHIRDFGSIATSGTKGEQRLKLREELLNVQKQPDPREETALGKRKVQDTQGVSDTVSAKRLTWSARVMQMSRALIPKMSWTSRRHKEK